MLRSSSLIVVRRVAASTRVVRLTTLRAVAVQRTTIFPYATEYSHQLNRCKQLSTSSSTEATSDHDMLDWKPIPVGTMNRADWNAALEHTSKLTLIDAKLDDIQTTVNEIKMAIIAYERLLEECRFVLQSSTQQRFQSYIEYSSATTNGAVEFTDLELVLSSQITLNIMQKWYQVHKRYYSSTPSEQTEYKKVMMISPQHMYKWLERVRTNFGTDEHLPAMDEESYRLVLHALFRQQNKTKRSNIDYAVSILRNFINAYKNKQSTLLRSSWFEVVIDKCARFGRFDVADRMLGEAENLYYKADDGRQLPFCSASMYASMMSAHRHKENYERGKSYFDRFMSIPTLQPHLDICYLQMKLIRGDNRVNTTDAARDAEALLMKMFDGAETHGWDTYPSMRCVEIAVHCWARDGAYEENTARVEAILDVADVMPWKDDLHSYCYIYKHAMHIWSLMQSSKSPYRVQELYERLIKNVGDENLIPPKLRADYVESQLTAWSRSKEQDVHIKLREIFDKYIEVRKINSDFESIPLTSKLYTMLIYAYGKSGKGDEAEEVLAMMINDYRSGNKEAFPELLSFYNVFVAWKNSRIKDNRSRIRRLFNFMVKLRAQEGFSQLEPPSCAIYDMLIKTLQRTEHKESALEGEMYFQQLLKLSRKGDERYQPTVFTFLVAMGLWQNIADPIAVEHATNTMDCMIDCFRRNKDARGGNFSRFDVYDVYKKIVLKSSLPSEEKDRRLARYSKSIQRWV